MKLGFTLKKTKKSVLHGSGAGSGAPGTNGAGGAATSAVAGVFSSALPTKQTVEKVFVTDFDPNARAAVEFDQDGNVKKALVIPLIKANAWKGDVEKGDSDGDGDGVSSSSNGKNDAKSIQQAVVKGGESMLSADELAAKELLADAKSLAGGVGKSGSLSSHAADLIIPMNGKLQEEEEDGGNNNQKNQTKKSNKIESEEDEKTREIKKKLFNFEAQEQNRKKQQQQGSDASMPTAPILRQNVVPGMDALEDVNEKYRLDVSMRPDELDVHSTAYDMVPIEDFGAALLRGMGWKGNADTDDKGTEPKPRHKLLGLGATIRPPIPGESKNKYRKKSSQQQQQAPVQSRGTSNKEDSKPRHSGLNHTESSSSSKEQKKQKRASRSPSPRRSSDDRSGSRHSGKDGSKRDSRDRRRSSSRDRHARSSRDDEKEDRRSRRRDEERRGSQSSSRRRSLSRERGGRRDRSSDRSSKRDRDLEKRSDRDDRRKRSRSRDERSSDRKGSSRQ